MQSVVAGLIGGENVGETVEGLARFPINLRYPREWRDSVDISSSLPLLTPTGYQITLGTVAQHTGERRPADAEKRKRAADRLGVCGCARP